ncbi:MAG: ABC-F family ATP-binding cassette domain-containing protein [Salinibacterium sp.]|nr:ATP-binding cassette domain-containing protein [Salinibacterium sp.]MBF0673553.1 ABC-F family ATP-binding cassette domain-containing protein [Salinibacterium sp.]
MPSPIPSVALHELSFAWPDGTRILDTLSGAFGSGRTGLTGLNGAGKSTLLRLIAGELAPTGGSISTVGDVAYLPQRITDAAGTTVAQLLGVDRPLAALRALEGGDASAEVFEAIGDDWDIEERALAELSARGLGIRSLDRSADTLSGGEAVAAALAGVTLRRAAITLLDEPTNNLDEAAREIVYDAVTGWRGALIVVSHDVGLLELMDATAELRAGTITTFGGPWSAYRAHVEAEQLAAQRALASAEQDLRRERLQRIRVEERIAHSERQGRKDKRDRKFVGAVINDRRNSAEKSQGARRNLHAAKVAEARGGVEAAGRLVRADDRIRIELPDPGVANGRQLASLRSSDGRKFIVQGPERIALTGANGVGKSTLARALLAGHADAALAHTQRVALLGQGLDDLKEDASVLQAVAAAAPSVPEVELRNRLARLLLRGDTVDRPVATLSGGERFRAAMARILLADPPPQLIVLDEPSNNLDLHSVGQLVDALAAYRGALLVISHDRDFLRRAAVQRELRLEPGGVLREIAL